jgi:hypothetical protein
VKECLHSFRDLCIRNRKDFHNEKSSIHAKNSFQLCEVILSRFMHGVSSLLSVHYIMPHHEEMLSSFVRCPFDC